MSRNNASEIVVKSWNGCQSKNSKNTLHAYEHGGAAELNHSWVVSTLFSFIIHRLCYDTVVCLNFDVFIFVSFCSVPSAWEQWPNVYTTRARTCNKFQNTTFYSPQTNYAIRDMYVTGRFVRPELQLNAQLINSETIAGKKEKQNGGKKPNMWSVK